MIEYYRNLLLSLLPPGMAFAREVGSVVYNLCYGLAVELSRIHIRALQLIEEGDPRTTNELLDEWEEAMGLPDACSIISPTQLERRDEVVNRFVSTGGQSRAYFIEFAASLGFTVTITEFRQFEVGRSTVGEALTNGDWAFAWQVNAPEETVKYFSVGKSVVGDELASWGNDILECKINKAKPAHTVVLFAYGT